MRVHICPRDGAEVAGVRDAVSCLEKLQFMERQRSELFDLVAGRAGTGRREYETVRVEVLLEAQDIRIGFGKAKILSERLEGSTAGGLRGVGSPGIS